MGFRFAPERRRLTVFDAGYGPTFEVKKLGGVIQQGLVTYITVGVDLSADYPNTQAWTP